MPDLLKPTFYAKEPSPGDTVECEIRSSGEPLTADETLTLTYAMAAGLDLLDGPPPSIVMPEKSTGILFHIKTKSETNGGEVTLTVSWTDGDVAKSVAGTFTITPFTDEDEGPVDSIGIPLTVAPIGPPQSSTPTPTSTSDSTLVQVTLVEPDPDGSDFVTLIANYRALVANGPRLNVKLNGFRHKSDGSLDPDDSVIDPSSERLKPNRLPAGRSTITFPVGVIRDSSTDVYYISVSVSSPAGNPPYQDAILIRFQNPATFSTP